MAGGAAGRSLEALERAIDAAVLEELRAVPLAPGRPLLAVDADEVLVEFAAHLRRFAAAAGVEMRLERYELEGTFFEIGGGRALPFDEAISLIDRFFEAETERQRAVPGAAEALGRLSERAQVVVLTNVPRHARAPRIANLAGLGMDYPLVANAGGKGPALAWLAARAEAPAAFVDDSPSQIRSAAAGAPGVARLHFAGADYVARVIPDCAEADHRVASWAEAERVLLRLLG
jgi:phosphoglycolate phosphatase-like HAD superfamily hydrolase